MAPHRLPKLRLDCAVCESPKCRSGQDCFDAADLVRQRYAAAGPEAAHLTRIAAAVEGEGSGANG